MDRALYGPAGFYRRAAPAAHFRTSVSASAVFAGAVARLMTAVDDALGTPQNLDLVDVGAGDGRLATDVLGQLPPDVRARTRAVAVELRARPAGLPDDVDWQPVPPDDITGLVVANEWLDNIPCDVVQLADGVLRQVLVDPTSGIEELGPPAPDTHRAWIEEWWPGLADGDRAEIGRHRDAAWSDLVGRLTRGLAVAIDYGHTRDERRTGLFNGGTLTGYREGRQVLPLPDGRCDITAHVAIDACACAAGTTNPGPTLLRQREALSALGVVGNRPPVDAAQRDPAAYLRALARASEAAELRDPGSLGSFWWLLQPKECRVDIPALGASSTQV